MQRPKIQIVELPLTAPQHDASGDEERVALKANDAGLTLAMHGDDYVLCNHSLRATHYRGTLREVFLARTTVGGGPCDRLTR
jgi:hypothetical protein